MIAELVGTTTNEQNDGQVVAGVKPSPTGATTDVAAPVKLTEIVGLAELYVPL